LAAAAGARRTDTAFPRMLKATNGSDVLVSATAGGQADMAFYDRVAQLDGVTDSGKLVALGLIPVSVPRGAGAEILSAAHISEDGRAGYEIDRPNIVAGRLPDPASNDQVLITKSYADEF